MSFFNTQNPGIGGLDEVTQAEGEFLADLAGLSFSQGDVLYFDGASLNRLAAGTSGYYLKTQGAGANPVWDIPSGQITVSDTAPSNPQINDLWYDIS